MIILTTNSVPVNLCSFLPPTMIRFWRCLGHTCVETVLPLCPNYSPISEIEKDFPLTRLFLQESSILVLTTLSPVVQGTRVYKQIDWRDNGPWPCRNLGVTRTRGSWSGWSAGETHLSPLTRRLRLGLAICVIFPGVWLVIVYLV